MMMAETSEIPRIANHIYLYGEITVENALKFSQAVTEARKESAVTGAPVTVHVNSVGGDVFSSFGIADVLGAIPGVVSIIEGEASSGASIIAMTCSRRMMTLNSWIMIHRGSVWLCGSMNDFKGTAEYLEARQRQIIDFYVTHSNLTRARVVELLATDTYIDAHTAFEYGMVDDVI
jgi:ATP-dependent Clp protease protease subunit